MSESHGPMGCRASAWTRPLQVLFCVLALAALLPAQEEAGGDAKPAVIPAAEQAKLAALRPDAAILGGNIAKNRRYYSSDLYQYIDGGAEVYHQYEMVALLHDEFKVKGAEFTVDIYDMGDPLKAFGIYSAERSRDYHFVEIGAEGYSTDELVNFFQGNYYVKILAFTDGPPVAATLDKVARNISQKIGGGREMPQAVAWFPSHGLVARSQRYVIQAPMGHDFLAPAATALYSLDGKESTLLVSIAANAAGAAERVNQLKQSFVTSGKLAPLAGAPVETWRGTNQYEGEMLFFAKGRYLVVVIGPPAQPEGLLRELLASIKD